MDGLTTALGRRPRVEQEQVTVVVALRIVAVTEDDDARLREPAPHPGGAAGRRTGVVNHRHLDATQPDRRHLGEPVVEAVVVVAEHSRERGPLGERGQNRGVEDVAGVEDLVSLVGQRPDRCGHPTEGVVPEMGVRDDKDLHRATVAPCPYPWRMEITRTQLPGAVIGFLRDGTSTVVEAPTGPVRLDGFTFGVADIDEAPPHSGEMHPDGDELLYVITGRAAVLLEDDGTQETIGTVTRHVLEPGDAFVVPKGHWHRIETLEPYRLVHLTPGPGDGHRPLTRD